MAHPIWDFHPGAEVPLGVDVGLPGVFDELGETRKEASEVRRNRAVGRNEGASVALERWGSRRAQGNRKGVTHQSVDTVLKHSCGVGLRYLRPRIEDAQRKLHEVRARGVVHGNPRAVSLLRRRGGDRNRRPGENITVDPLLVGVGVGGWW